MVVVVLNKKILIYRKGNAMYYIYDNYHEEWYSVAFADFEMAEEEMVKPPIVPLGADSLPLKTVPEASSERIPGR